MPSIADKIGFLSASETAARLKISPDTLKRLVAEERIPYVTTPLGRLFVEAEITDYAKTFVRPRRGRRPKATRHSRHVAAERRSSNCLAASSQSIRGGERR